MLESARKVFEELSVSGEEVQITEIQNWGFVWRPLSRAEHRNVRGMGLNPGVEEELICSLCVLWPEDYDWHNPVKAGHPTAVCAEIIKYSGFLGWESTQAILAEHEEDLKYLDFFMEPVICAAFPSIRPEEPQTWTQRHALWMYSRAKWVMENIHGLKVDVAPPKSQAAPLSPNQQPPSSTPKYIIESEPWVEDIFFGEEEIPDIPGFPKV